jgi:hypothetical protein
MRRIASKRIFCEYNSDELTPVSFAVTHFRICEEQFTGCPEFHRQASKI